MVRSHPLLLNRLFLTSTPVPTDTTHPGQSGERGMTSDNTMPHTVSYMGKNLYSLVLYQLNCTGLDDKEFNLSVLIH